MVTCAFVPLKTSALPNLPAVVHVAPLIVPVLLFPEASVTVVPLPSLKLYAATKEAAWSGKTVTVTVAVAVAPWLSVMVYVKPSVPTKVAAGYRSRWWSGGSRCRGRPGSRR